MIGARIALSMSPVQSGYTRGVTILTWCGVLVSWFREIWR
jgi:hypothetical protein